jgi:hypothetical protein
MGTVLGEGNQTALKSWFPLSLAYDSCGENYGRWTFWNETEYDTRVRDIQNGGQPLPFSHWRTKLRGMKKSRQLKKAISKLSDEFLDSAFRR